MFPLGIINYNNSPGYLLDDIFFQRKAIPNSFSRSQARRLFQITSSSNSSNSSNSNSSSSSESSPEISPQKKIQIPAQYNENPIRLSVSQYSPEKSEQQTNFISCLLEATNQRGALFISDFQCASDLDLLKDNNIETVLTIDKNDNFFLPRHISHKKIIAFDNELFKIKVHFESCLEFIQEALNNKRNVLVHCRRGISRSAAIVIAYFIKHHNLTFQQAYEYVHERRSIINPNKGFIDQLKAFEKTINEYRQNSKEKQKL